MEWKKLGRVFSHKEKLSWWESHTMAPVVVRLSDEVLRAYIGCLDANGISRIGYVDLDASDPTKVLGYSENPVLDIGKDGMFDENGVFPASVLRVENKIYLYYTGFQLGHKIRYYMFSGLAISEDNGKTFTKVADYPVLDRSNEGFCTRAGMSALYEDGKFKIWYNAGNDWVDVGGKPRPTYDVFQVESEDSISIPKEGTRIIKHNPKVEHGLGRPQITKIGGKYRLFYTRRTVDMKYHSGYSESIDGIVWERKDEKFSINHGPEEWDSEMVYFPSVIEIDEEVYLFYNGNNFGETGFGCAQLISW